MDKIRIGVVGGAGGIGWGSHLPAIEALPVAELAAICDLPGEALDETAARYGVDAYDNLEGMLRRDDIDLVDITSPDFLHAEHAIAAARAGKHILCEKPMALSLDEAAGMKRAVQAAGVKFMMAQSQRWRPECIAFRRACEKIGTPAFTAYHVKGRHFNYPPDSFYRKKESLGQFVHNGMHWVDFICWCIGSLPVRVYAAGTRHYPTEDQLETDNYFVANVTYDSGAIGVYELNLLMLDPPGFPTEVRWYVVGDEGTAEHCPPATRQVEAFGPGGMSYPATGPSGTDRDPFRGEIGHMCSCILRDEPPSISMDWSIRVLATCLGVVKSAQTHEPVDLAAPAKA